MVKVWAGLWICVAMCVSAGAQMTDVQLTIHQDDIGVGGYIQPGVWTGIRLELTNQSAAVRNITAQWISSDEDGDQVLAQRTAAVNPGVTQPLWLYMDIPMAHRAGLPQLIQIQDEKTVRLLATQQVTAAQQIAVTRSVIGVCATTDLGLGDYAEGYTQHEAPQFIRGLTLSGLPDRWYGLLMLRALIWTDEAADPFNDPSDASVTPQVCESLRQWVSRGGHLVISLPAVGQHWSDSPLGDLMPVSRSAMQMVEDFDAIVLGPTLPNRPRAIKAIVFDVDDKSAATVLAVDRQKRPYIVAKRYGFGRVTLIGVDLSSGPVRRLGLPAGRMRIWHTVFHWNAPLVTKVEYDGEVRNMKMASVSYRNTTRLDEDAPRLIAMTGRAAAALFLAMIVFSLYWLIAGPLTHVFLKRRGKMHLSWLIFVAVGIVFTVITWGGAWIMRPAHITMQHISILDIDTNTGLVHTRSWLSVLVPKFGQVEMALDAQQHSPGQWLASPGLDERHESGQFLDPQSYVQNAADPRAAVVPVRSTAKRFSLDYMGPLNDTLPGIDHPWVVPQGKIRMAGAWPVGELVHGLPGELKNVYIIFCPGTMSLAGDLNTPWITHIGSWPAKQPIQLTAPPTMIYERFLRHPSFYGAQNSTFYGDKRTWLNEGYLGRLVRNQKAGSSLSVGVKTVDDRLIRELQMLSFYDALPPPSFRDTRYLNNPLAGPAFYQRALLRSIDLTPMIAGKRLILIAQLQNSSLPAPLTLDGETIPGTGLTFIRWIYDL